MCTIKVQPVLVKIFVFGVQTLHSFFPTSKECMATKVWYSSDASLSYCTLEQCFQTLRISVRIKLDLKTSQSNLEG